MRLPNMTPSAIQPCCNFRGRRS